MTPLEVALALLVSLAMFAQGLDLELGQLAQTLRAPQVLLWGLGLNAVVLPLAALAAIAFFSLSGSLAAAVLLCAAAPGGGTGGLLAASVRGDMTLATALQVLLAASLLLTPFWLALGLPLMGDAETLVRAALVSVLWYQWLPLVVGLVLRRQQLSLATRLYPWVKRAANGLLLALIAVLLWRDGANLAEQGWEPTLVMGLLALTTFVAAGCMPGTKAERATLRMVTVNRNLSLALLLAASLLHDPAALLLILIYALAMYLVCGFYILRVRSTV